MNLEQPVFRRLRVYAFDPGLAAQMDTIAINEVVLQIPWEPLKPGPEGEYVTVIDEEHRADPWAEPGGSQARDPGRAFEHRLFDPINLNDPSVLARDGLLPSDGNPQFHQQMVYAVAMRTIDIFEQALGRRIHWLQKDEPYVRRLKIYPHGLPQANAFYDAESRGIYLGHFRAFPDSPYPGMLVFTCLSQDVIAHLTAQAALIALRPQFANSANPDTLAFAEAFCDIVALFERFSLPQVVRHQLALCRGDLTAKAQLGVLAQQFGEAIGKKGGLRSALGDLGDDGIWRPKQPDPAAYRTETEPHARGNILLSAIFDAFNRIYRARAADLFRIATEGTGVLPQGDLHPDLVGRLAQECAKAARQVLDMCVRALDYCPAVDITFGDYLRAILTADYDLVPDDPRHYRVAFIEAFRRFGIFPASVSTLSMETLLWPQPAPAEARMVREFIRRLGGEYTVWTLPRDREKLYRLMRRKAQQLERFLRSRGPSLGKLGEIDLTQPLHVQSIWPRERTGLNGDRLSQWVIEIVQERGQSGTSDQPVAGSTMLVDADSGLIRYVIHKVAGDRRDDEQIDFFAGPCLSPVPLPSERSLRVFAFDPSTALQLETAAINQVTLKVPWEALKPGPAGEYLEVVDYDPATECFYDPADLEHAYLIAENGYTPSQGNPQFHQQMVYAVAMRTIRNFERALGRLALWAPREEGEAPGGATPTNGLLPGYVRRLRLYPHALREANAFYSPQKRSVLFGYFQSKTAGAASPTTVFTCLSHDVIAHEVTHALLDGMHKRFDEPSNPDVLAFHEAFADIVALFQHFSLPEALQHQIAATRGDLASQNRLGELAQEFGTAIGNHGALRSAIGRYDPETERWEPLKPDPEAYASEMEPHARGALLVATIFDAFLTLYRSRIGDLFRIATRGTGVLPAGQLHPDLVRRLAAEAANSAQTVLDMCIRALDYCPPVDITFGEYLRAIITADCELDPVDEDNHRVAFIEAFRRHGILPDNVRAFSLEGLLWKEARDVPGEDEAIVIDFIADWTARIPSWNLSQKRQELYDLMAKMKCDLYDYLREPARYATLKLLDHDYDFEVQSLRPSTRIDRRGKSHFQWIIEITQAMPEYLDAASDQTPGSEPDYYFRGGATLIVDAETGQVRYSIRKNLKSQRRRELQRRYRREVLRGSLAATYFAGVHDREPFAALHRF